MHGAKGTIARTIQEIGIGVTPLKRKVLETAVNLNSITEWVTADEVETAFSMSKSVLRAYTYRYKIPTKREFCRTYYSKEHLEELRRTDLMSDDSYYTTEQQAAVRQSIQASLMLCSHLALSLTRRR